jgi:hypothetical protein
MLNCITTRLPLYLRLRFNFSKSRTNWQQYNLNKSQATILQVILTTCTTIGAAHVTLQWLTKREVRVVLVSKHCGMYSKQGLFVMRPTFVWTHSCPQSINEFLKERLFGMCTKTERFPNCFSSQASRLFESILVTPSVLLQLHWVTIKPKEKFTHQNVEGRKLLEKVPELRKERD